MDCIGILGNVKILSLTLLNSEVNSAIQYLQLFFLKSQIDESISPAVFEQKITPKYGEIHYLHLFVNNHVVWSNSLFATWLFWGNNHLHNYFILFKFDFFLSSFNNLFKQKKFSNRNLNREKMTANHLFELTQGSVISTLMYISITHCN